MSEFKTNAMRILDKRKINYKVYSYEPDGGIDGISVADKLNIPEEKVYKTLVTKGKNDFFIFVVPVNKELDLKKAAKSVSEKSVEMIAVKDINKTTGYIRGGCSPIGMRKLYRTVIDDSAALLDSFVFSGGKIGYQIEAAPYEIAELLNAQFINIVL